MKTLAMIHPLLAVLMVGFAQAAPEAPALRCPVAVTPEIKKAFAGHDAIEVKGITGTAANFQVGGTHRITGVCRQETLAHAMLAIGNTAEIGAAAIVPAAGSSLSKDLPPGFTAFDCTFTLLRPGILHATVYDMDSLSKRDNTVEGIYLGDVVFKR